MMAPLLGASGKGIGWHTPPMKSSPTTKLARKSLEMGELNRLLQENRRLRVELDAKREENDALRAEKYALREPRIALAAQTGRNSWMTPEMVMQIIGGYETRAAFLRMARRTGLRRIMVNRRVIRFDQADVDAWKRRRAA
jgi:hypothetical protein